MTASFTPSPQLYPFSAVAETSAGRVHYVDEGEGRPLVALHGNPTWSFMYRHLIQALGQALRCVAVDYPGFGLSDRPDGYGYTPAEHAAVVDELGLDGLIVMGHEGAVPSASRWRRRDRSASPASSSATPGSGPPSCGHG
jgi:haloalkane dehalogenase